MNLKCPICRREVIGDIEEPVNYYTCNICKTNIMENKNLSADEINEMTASTAAMLYASTAAKFGKKKGTNLTPKKKKRKK